MKNLSTVLLCTLMSISHLSVGQTNSKNFTISQPSSDFGENSNWYNQAIEKAEALQRLFVNQSGQWHTINQKNKMHFAISDNFYNILDMETSFSSGTLWQAGLKLQQITRSQNPYKLSDLKPETVNDFLEFSNAAVAIQYENGSNGLRQNFILKNKLPGTGKVKIDLDLSGNLTYSLLEKNVLGGYLKKGNSKKLKLLYDDLKVWDASGKYLAAEFKLSSANRLTIEVDDKNAVYPVTVDPLSHLPEWTTSADGVLPGLLTDLQLQVDALYGYKVAGLGDVNADGFDDVAIGAPTAIDILNGSPVVGAGAVFVYFGSATGLPVSPSRVLRSSTPIANALFGYSIAGGNIVGTGKNDIVVGAPGESYTANVSGFPSTANVTAGKVFVFDGDNISGTGPFASTSVFLNGNSFFSNGITGVQGSNVTIKALFGFSVAVAEDVTGDGLGELIVGAPGYASLDLVPVKTGGAFIFNSQALTVNTPIVLTAPTTSVLGIPLVNLGGLLFGYSVDGMGDYNEDGFPDVIVGAPAGTSLTGGNILGGSAYIFYGSASSGISTTIGAKLSGRVSLENLLPDLFGFAVKGLRNANGARNGKVMIGAPLGNSLSNIAGGLKLKTGSVNVFSQNATPAGFVQPNQILSSPRGNSLLSILAMQNLDVSALFGASLDNMRDVNCDGINDIIVGEPLSTGVGIINANAVGGAAFIFTGNPSGSFDSTPVFNLTHQVSQSAGVNAASLLGYSVAGAGFVKGNQYGVRAIVGAPGAALDFGSELFNFSGTLGTLFSFTAANNGLGKAYAFGFDDCSPIYTPDFNSTLVDVTVTGNTSVNDKVPAASTYGTPVPDIGNPGVATINLNSDGSYDFITSTPGVYKYLVPVCLPAQTTNCKPVSLIITVIATNSINPPVANTDVAMTLVNIPVSLNSLLNDRCSNLGCSLNPASVTVITAPSNGNAIVNAATGFITYIPNPGFTGYDTLSYSVSDNGSPAGSATAMQIIFVKSIGTVNTTLAADDFYMSFRGNTINGTVIANDSDPENNTQTVTAYNSTVAAGIFSLSENGNFTFIPASGFTGPVDFVYTICDNGTQQACAKATLHIVVSSVAQPAPDLTPGILLPFNNFAVSTSKNIVLQLQELLNLADTETGQISFSVTVPLGYTIAFEPTMSSAAVTGLSPNPYPVENSNWTLISSQLGNRKLNFKANAGIKIAKAAKANIGFTITRSSGSASSPIITVNIIDDTSFQIYDSNNGNNIFTRIINSL